MGWALLRSGHPREGVGELELALALSPGNHQWLAQLGQAHALTGSPAKAREILAGLERWATKTYVSPYHLVFVHVGLGEHDRALDILERAVDERAAAAYGIDGSFLLAPLRSHPRYGLLRKKLNLPQLDA